MADLDQLIRPQRYPRSSGYDPAWLLSLDMGPHPLWQLEDLLDGHDPGRGARVLDLGAGLGATSVYLVREYDAHVVSLDYWTSVGERAAVLRAQGVDQNVELLDADIRTVDLGRDAFDAIVSVDAFEYFGTDVRFLPHLLRSLRHGGIVAMSTPALSRDPYDAGVPKHVRNVAGWEAAAWHAPEWWQKHWQLSGLLTDIQARWQDGGREDWLLWETVRRSNAGESGRSPVIDMLRQDDGRLGFALVSARKR